MRDVLPGDLVIITGEGLNMYTQVERVSDDSIYTFDDHRISALFGIKVEVVAHVGDVWNFAGIVMLVDCWNFDDDTPDIEFTRSDGESEFVSSFNDIGVLVYTTTGRPVGSNEKGGSF